MAGTFTGGGALHRPNTWRMAQSSLPSAGVMQDQRSAQQLARDVSDADTLPGGSVLPGRTGGRQRMSGRHRGSLTWKGRGQRVSSIALKPTTRVVGAHADRLGGAAGAAKPAQLALCPGSAVGWSTCRGVGCVVDVPCHVTDPVLAEGARCR